MAVQKSRCSRAKRGNRRMHDRLQAPSLSVEGTTGEIFRSHHISPSGYYKGKLVLVKNEKQQEAEAESLD